MPLALPLLIAGLILRFGTHLHGLGDLLALIGGGLIGLQLLFAGIFLALFTFLASKVR